MPAFGSWEGEEGRVPEECDGVSPAGPAHGSVWAGCGQHRTPCAGRAGCPQAPPWRCAPAKQPWVFTALSAHNVHLALPDHIQLPQGHLTPLELLTQGSPAENSAFEAWFEGIKHTLGLSYYLIACPGWALCLHSLLLPDPRANNGSPWSQSTPKSCETAGQDWVCRLQRSCPPLVVTCWVLQGAAEKGWLCFLSSTAVFQL